MLEHIESLPQVLIIIFTLGMGLGAWITGKTKEQEEREELKQLIRSINKRS